MLLFVSAHSNFPISVALHREVCSYQITAIYIHTLLFTQINSAQNHYLHKNPHRCPLLYTHKNSVLFQSFFYSHKDDYQTWGNDLWNRLSLRWRWILTEDYRTILECLKWRCGQKGRGSCDTYDKHSTTQDDYKHAGCYLWLLTTSNTHIPHNQISVAYLIKYNQINGKIIL